jgi:uncharacterized protein YprB with RNaseH-like and TPR domain
MTKEQKQEYLEKISFSNLVKAIDEKWSHTYIDPPKEDNLEIFFDIETTDSSL